MPETTPEPLYCTVLSTNYLPKALALADSLVRHHPGSELVVLLIDARSDDQLPTGLVDAPNVTLVSTAVLGLPEREVLRLSAIYDLVEFATAVKPLFFAALLERSEQVAYLDPDTYVTSPMVELPRDLAASEGGILLTPHFLEPTPAGSHLSEGHLLTVGVFNLGFCALDRRAGDFLQWWWGHLRSECLWEPLSGLFVDQKWVDIGATLFRASAWRHYGYNVSVANLHERPVAVDDDGYLIASSGDRLRLFHFHAFDTQAPQELSTRFDGSTEHLRASSQALSALCDEYAKIVIGFEQNLPPAPPYPYATDTRGRRISRQLRRAYRVESGPDGAPLPSPFLPEDADRYEAWRKRAWRAEGRGLVGDAAKSLRLALPEEYGRAKSRFPRLAGRLRGQYVDGSGIWG